MGFLCPDDAPQQVTTESSSSIPQYMQQFGQEQIQMGQELAKTPFAPFPGQMVEPFSTPQQQAFGDVAANQGIWQSALGSAGQDFAAGVGGYMNPYMDTVKAGVNRSFDQSQLAQDAAVTQAGALGGDRRGIYDAEIAGQRARALGDVDAAAYNQGADRFFQDKSRMGALAGLQQGMAAGDVGQLQQIGAQQQALGQANIDANYGEFMREQQHPFEMMNVRQAAGTGLPYATSSTYNQTIPGASGGVLNTLGSVAGIAGGVGSLFAAPEGGQSAMQGFGNWWDSF